MSVRIRLKKLGTKKKPHFKIVVCPRATSRDTSIEELGYYDPSKNPVLVKINKERAEYWLKNGAQASNTVKSILKKA
jgi:small subunit ribosomal protein S16